MLKFKSRRKYESCDDPGELILSLVDAGALSADDVLVTCIKLMSDADCLKVLQHVELDCDDDDSCDDSDEDEITPVDSDDFDYTDEESDNEESEESDDSIEETEEPEESESDVAEACKRARLEKRLRRLEHAYMHNLKK